MIAAVHSGASISVGADHPAYTVAATPLAPAVRDSLTNDLQVHAIN
jgi:hypothetical protein